MFTCLQDCHGAAVDSHPGEMAVKNHKHGLYSHDLGPNCNACHGSFLGRLHRHAVIPVPATLSHFQDVSRMVDALPDVEIKEIHDAMVGVFERMKKNLLAEGILPDKLPKRASSTA